MFRLLRGKPSAERLADLERQLADLLEAGDAPDKALGPLLDAQRDDRDLAERLAGHVANGAFEPATAAAVLSSLFDAHRDDADMLASMGEATEGARDIDQLNLAAPADAVFDELVASLEAGARAAEGEDNEQKLLIGLSVAARMCARQHDEVAEWAYRRLVELSPEQSSAHYNLGLWQKTRGRFADGLESNQRAAALAREPHEAYDWNLGICATGAGEGQTALAVWKRLGQKIEMGRFDLPDGGYPECKVRLAEFPLAERDTSNDEPGLEETIWVERVSPCHGIVRSVLYQDLGVDYGDVVLFDGAPITYHKYGDSEVPVFPHLATLRRGGFRFYDFAGTQDEAGQLESASRDLPAGALIYSHTENLKTLCRSCWRDPDLDHARHEEEEQHVVTGRIAIAPEIDLPALADLLDQAIAARPPCRLFAPDLSRALGQNDRARFEQRRFDILHSA